MIAASKIDNDKVDIFIAETVVAALWATRSKSETVNRFALCQFGGRLAAESSDLSQRPRNQDSGVAPVGI